MRNDLTLVECAKLLNVSKETIRRRLKDLPNDCYYREIQGKNSVFFIRPEGVAILTGEGSQLPPEPQNTDTERHNSHNSTTQPSTSCDFSQNSATAPQLDLSGMQQRLDLMSEQLQYFREQLSIKDKQIESANEQLHAATMERAHLLARIDDKDKLIAEQGAKLTQLLEAATKATETAQDAPQAHETDKREDDAQAQKTATEQKQRPWWRFWD